LMGRTNLGRLLGNIDDPIPSFAVERTALSTFIEPRAGEKEEAPDTPKQTAVRSPEPAELVGPTYLRFIRKDTRLRADQLEALTAHARRLNRKRHTAGPRVTENTLIRVAVELLLDRIEMAAGDGEDALLESVRR
jgi:hypothetical protein